MTHPDLYARQRQLPEIGEAGQELLCSSTFREVDGLDASARRFAQLYAGRAGISDGQHGEKDYVTRHLPAIPLLLQQGFRHSSSRDVGLGAAAALMNILDILDPSPKESPATSSGVHLADD